MISGSKAEISILRTFCREPFRYFSIKELAENVKISKSWVYRVIGELERNEMILKERKTYRLDYSNIMSRRLKLFFDSEFVLSLSIGKRVIELVNRIVYNTSPDSVLVAGSAAVGKYADESDIDFLVVASKKEIPQINNVNIVVMEKNDFERGFMKGDDFIISSLSYGKLIYDREYLINFYSKPLPPFSAEVLHEKIELCERLRKRAYSLLRVDVNRARDEVLNLALQCARIILLKKGMIPGVKREIPDQIEKENEKLAEIIRSLLERRKIEETEIIHHLKFCSELISKL